MATALRVGSPLQTPQCTDERCRFRSMAPRNPPRLSFSRSKVPVTTSVALAAQSPQKHAPNSSFFRKSSHKFRSTRVIPKIHQNFGASRTLGLPNTERVSARYPSVVCRAGSNKGWTSEQSPYETLGIERDAGENEIKSAYRRLVKRFHPDVYNASSGSGDEGEAGVKAEAQGGAEGEGETAEARFIRIQAAYELLMDRDERRQYDIDNRVDPMKASKAWVEWVRRKKKAFDQRGDMAMSAWAEQQQRELNLRARQLSKDKSDPDERRILARERAAAMEAAATVIKRQSLVLKKRDLERRRAEEAAKKRLVADLLALEG